MAKVEAGMAGNIAEKVNSGNNTSNLSSSPPSQRAAQSSVPQDRVEISSEARSLAVEAQETIQSARIDFNSDMSKAQSTAKVTARSMEGQKLRFVLATGTYLKPGQKTSIDINA